MNFQRSEVILISKIPALTDVEFVPYCESALVRPIASFAKMANKTVLPRLNCGFKYFRYFDYATN